MKTPISTSRFDPRNYFARGESLVAVTGMAFIAILTMVVGGVVWVSARAVDESAADQAQQRMLNTSTLIASQAELRLSDNDLAGLRRLMLDTVASSLAEQCQISIPGVGVIASSNTSLTTIDELPEAWPASDQLPPSVTIDPKTHHATVNEPLSVDGQSGLVLELIIDQSQQIEGADTIRASSVGIVSVGLVLTLLVYRRFRTRLGALAAIGESLRAASEGERRVECLVVGENLGREARAWNTLLHEHREFERSLGEREIVEAGVGGVESFGLPGACNMLTQGVVLVDSDQNVLYANGAASVFLRCVRDQLVGAPITRVEGFEPVLEAVFRVLTDPNATRQVVELGQVDQIEAQGAVLRVAVARVVEDDIPRAMIFIEDITQQRLADQSQNAFIAQATHELRTPLTTIRLYSEEAIEAGNGDEQIREKALNVIASETRRLERIVGDMLCVAEIEAGSLSVRPDTLRTEQLFAELQEDYVAQAKDKSIELSFELPPKFPTIRADRDRLGQALHNLVGNAIKYTPSGGKVGVSVGFDEHDAMTIEISDNGIGIDPSQQERIFDRFCRADDRRIAKVTGSGLGLALARQIARLHGGDVTVESEIDHGSTFTLFIPGNPEMANAA